MAKNIKLLPVTDFTGGLNLNADAFQLRGTESPDLLNVDLDKRGGFRLRDGVTPLNSQLLPQVPKNAWTFQTTTGTKQILVQQAGQFAYSTGGNFTQVQPDANVTTGVLRSTTFKDNNYIQRNADYAAVKWTGAAATVLGTAFNDNIAAPTGGNMPKAKLITTWQGYVWVANTVEGASTLKNRVRWSHPNQPEDFRTNDYIDIDTGHDGDEITAILPMADRLLVFKANSVYAIFGYDASSFSVRTLSTVAGAVSQEAVALTEHGTYFWNWPQGLFHLPISRRYTLPPVWVFQNLWPAIQNSSIPGAAAPNVTVSWTRRRLWVSVPWGTSTTNARTYVMDPQLAGEESGNGWTLYSLALGPIVEWKPGGQTDQYLACSATKGRVLKLHQQTGKDEYRSDYLNCPGASGAYAWAPDTANVSHTGNMEIRAFINATNYTPGTAMTLVAKWETTSNQRSYSLSIDTAGKLFFEWSADGTTVLSATSTVVTGITNGTDKFVRASLKVGNPWQVLFYTSSDGVTWTALGAAVNGGVGTSVFDSTARVTVGARLNAGTQQMFTGRIYWAQVSADLVGTDVRVYPDFTAQTGGTTTFNDTAATPAAWTIVSTAALVYTTTNFSSYYTTRWFDAEQPAIIKRWRRPEIVLKGGSALSIRINSWRDYDPFTLHNSATISTTTTPGVLVWDDGTHASSMKWNNNAWAGSDAANAQEQISRIGILGRGRSVRLRFTGPDNPTQIWQVDGITFKYIPRRVRA